MISKIRLAKETIIFAMSFFFSTPNHSNPLFFSGRQCGASKIRLTNQQHQNTKIRIALFLAIDTLATGNLAAHRSRQIRSGRANERMSREALSSN